jgi:NAD(P) transhydrogenase
MSGMPLPTRFDLVVIGGGPAGEHAAVAAAQAGKRVALVDASPEGPGGAAVHTGTLPSKTLRESALYLTGFRRRELYDLVRDPPDGQHMTAALTRRLATVVARQTDQIRAHLRDHDVELVAGRARFLDAHRVEAGVRTLEASFFLIATGSSPRRPPGFDFNDPEVFDSDTILALDRVPSSLAVIGGGVIGSEYASVFGALGTEITLIESGPRLLSFLDHEMSDAIAGAMRRQGIDVRLEDGVVSVARRGADLLLTLKSGKVEVVDRVLVSAGRTGNTGGLNLPSVGVKVDERGIVIVDAALRSSRRHIFAAGDVIGRPALASSSIEQGRVAVASMFDLPLPARDWSTLASGIYTIPEAASCGPTEAELSAQAVPVVIGRAAIAENARGQIIGDTDGFIKLIFHRDTRRLLATHVICERATEVIHLGQAVIRLGGDLNYFLETVMTYPSLSDGYKQAAYDALRRAEGKGQRAEVKGGGEREGGGSR